MHFNFLEIYFVFEKIFFLLDEKSAGVVRVKSLIYLSLFLFLFSRSITYSKSSHLAFKMIAKSKPYVTQG